MTARILNTRPCERRYYAATESSWFAPEAQTRTGQLWTQPLTTEVTDLVTIDISQRDLQRLLDLELHHARVQRDPRVRDAWEKYQLALCLTGALPPGAAE